MFIRHLGFSLMLFAAGLGISAAQSSAVTTNHPVGDIGDIPAITGLHHVQPELNNLQVATRPLVNPLKSSCFALRIYQFALSDPSGDSRMILKGEKSCQSVASLQWKDILEPMAAPQPVP